MRLEQSFEVQAPIERVWSALTDVEQVASRLPGAAVSGRNEDGSYNGTFSVKIGATTASYSGKLALENADEARHSATIRADGTDGRGQGAARATIVSTLAPAGTGTLVEVDTDYQITGPLAGFGRGGMIKGIADRLLREFAANLQASLEDGGSAPPAPAPEAVEAGPLVASVAWQRVRDNAPVLVAAIGALLVLLALWRRR